MIQNDVELISELSPMQQAMLFASLYAPGSGVYVVQLSLRLTGRLDVAAFERAWRRVVDRHDALRTGFHWEGLEKPMQVVEREVDLRVRRESWRGLGEAEQEARLRDILDADRETGFDLGEPPLMRLALFELAAGSWHLVWSLHHLVVDGWSLALLLNELFTCYAAYAAGREPSLPAPRSYGDYIEWLQRQDAAEAEAFWRRSLAGISAPTLIAGGDGRGAAGFRQARHRTACLTAEETAALRELARRHRLTLNTLLQGAWSLVLAQATGGSEVLFGSTVAGRPGDLPGADAIVGLFINTLPVRVEVDRERPLLPWLAELQERQSEARRYEHAPLYEVQTWSGLPAGSPLFDNILVVERAPLDGSLAAQAPDLAITQVTTKELTSYPLNVVVVPRTELSLELIYDTGRFNGAAAIGLLERLAGALRAFVAAPDRRLGEVPLLLEAERQQVLVEWNDTETGYPREASVPELFAAVAAASPDAPALVEGEEVWSYRRLHEASSRLARQLSADGVKPGARVGVAMERSADLVVAFLAVLKAGAAYVPLDPGYPDERLAFMLADTGAAVVLVHERTRERMAALPRPQPGEGGEGLAYVIYTSGSTGQPKGVAVPHQAIVRLVRETDYAQLGPGDRVAHLSNTSFDAATFEIWGALLNGATVVVVPREMALAPAELAALLRRERVTALFLTTALFNQMVREAPGAFDTLRWVLFGGEAVDPGLVARALEQAGPERLLHVYGPTESTTYATWHRVREVPEGVATVPIGLPLANTAACVLDRWGQPVPPGVAGELFLGGDGLAWGYWNRPELTAERFVPEPWGTGGRLYRTGDLVRRRPAGPIEFLGRLDNQVKIRGFRIEPGEIEAVLLRHPEVREAVVLAREEAAGRRLIAWVVLNRTDPTDRTDRSDSKSALTAWLRERLPDYMVPAAWVFLPALPLTPNGKVDRKALPAPERSPAKEEGYAPLADPVEELLAGIWAEVLGLARVGSHDDFFALGGHSLLATQVASRIRGVLGVELPLRSVFEEPTVAGLARVVRQGLEGEDLAPPLVRVPRDPASNDLPLSFAQQRLWFIDRLEPGNPGYNIPAAMRLAGDLSIRRLERVFAEVVRRHEVLRTTFASREGRPVQVIHPELTSELPVVDLAALPAAAREALARRLTVEESLRPFDLEQGPLLRTTLLRLGAREHSLLLTLHHIVSDGWSMGVLVRELLDLYRGRPLPELPVQYADFAAWQRRWLAGEILEHQLAWWREQLAGTSGVLELPVDHARPAQSSLRGGEHLFALKGELSRRVQELGRREGATPFMILAAALLALLSRLSGQRDLNLGAPIANRNRIETEGLIGFFVNTLVLRADMGRAEVFLDLLFQVRETSLGAYAHQDLPFEKLVDEVQPERDLSRSPLVQVALAVNNAPISRADLEGLRLVPEPPPSLVAKFDLAFIVNETEEGCFAGSLQYATDLYDATTAARLTGQLATFLDALTAEPEQPLSDLSPLTAEERHQVLFEWNDTADGDRPGLLMHQLFEEQADARPAAVAAVCEERSWSYAELEARANRLARFLEGLVGRGTPVGVWMERSLPMLATVLGTLKTGGAYVPLDAAWPAERVERILADTGAPVIVVDRTTLPAIEKIRWRLPRLGDAICLEVEAPELEPERVDVASVRSLFDFVAEQATDRATAGGFVHRDNGLPFSEAEVDEYQDRVLSLAAPWLRPDARVLEVGSGSGLILWEMARRVERSVGLDPSERTQERNREHARAKGLSNVELPVGFADEIGERFAPGSFDLVVLASTVQFFPGPRYLEKVMADALRLLAPGGALLVADVIDARVEPGTDKLALDEDLFHDLGSAEIHHRADRRGGFANELGERYDVILRPGEVKRKKRTWTGWHVERASSLRPAAVGAPEDVAYVIHTSGSTGTPKGIAVQHGPAVDLIRWVNRTFGMGPADRLLFITSLCFDLSVYDVFGTLAAGGTVHVASEAALREPTELVRLLRREPITIWDSAPAALQQLAPLFPEGEASPLRLVMLSGDWIPVTLPDQVREAFPGAQVVSLGGATEATVWSNWYPIVEVDPRWPSIPYGRPIANARYHVLDEGLLPCPIGIPGDLYIGGACLSVGYLGQPDLTSASFLPDPFSAEPGARLYRTGDRTRFFRDGNLEFLGRVDQQVKVRGYRIELGEIEVALLRHPAVQECVVVARENRLVAYVVLDPTDPTDRTDRSDPKPELAAWLRDRLPQYMLPTAFVLLEAMPVTPNGKLDRKALPEPRDESEGSGAAPRTPVEELLAGIWREVLGRERVGVEESFFDLGGHSLLVMQLLARLRSVFGVDLPVRRIFEAPTVAACARVVEEELRGGALVPPPVTPVPHQDGAPLSSAQNRLWFEHQLAPDSAAYNVPLSFRIDGPVRVSALVASLREVVRRHEALRTTVQVIDGEVLQVAGPPPGAVLLLADLTALPPHRREEEVARLARWTGDAPFDLTRGPVFRALCAGLTEESWRLLLTLHHIALDGWSGNVLARELVAGYQAFAEGRPPLLPELPVQFADFARWERGWMQGEVLAEHQRYWLGQLEGIQETPELPGDRPLPLVPAWRAGWAPLRVDADLTESVRELGRAAGATLFMTLLAAFDALVHLHTGAEDVVIAAAGANRIRPEVEPLIGCFLNLLVLRTNLSGRPTFRELLARARETALGAYAYQGLPFDWLMEAWQRGRADRDARIFHMLFEMQGGFTPAATPDGLTFTWLPFHPGVVKYDLTVYLREEDGGLGGDVAYNTDRFSPGWTARLLADFRLVLEAMVRDPDREVAGGVDLTGSAELRAELAQDLSLGCPPYENVRLWVRRSAAVHAERIAIEQGDAQLTYRELEARASALTDCLLRRGLARGSVVGVLTYSSSRLATALLGILEAGGIFLPLDPRVPAMRLAELVAEASPRWFLVDPELAGLAAVISPKKAALRVLGFDDLETAVDDRPEDPPETVARPELSGDDPCYIYFTSGSTGRPKGVTGRLRGIDHFVRWEIETFDLGHGARVSPRVSQIAAPSFDAFLRDTFVPLCTGGTMCVPPDRELLADAEWLAGWIDRQRIELIHCVPSLFRALLGTELTPERFPALRYVVMAGEPLLPADVQRWTAAFGARIELVNLYGNSETTMAKFLYRVRPEDAERRMIPAGKPIRGAQGFILDALGAFRPAGAVGEILIRTPYRSLGYYNRPEETNRSFVPNPLRDDPDDLLYRSGDLGRLLENGNFEFLGRKDQQVKIRGVRVELEEVEGVLSRHDGVREAAVVEQPDGTGGFLLASFVVLRPGGDVAPLRGYLAERLPDAMVPSRFFAVEELPRSMNGKIDRGALRALAEEQSGAEAEHVAPRNELEEMVAGLFSRLLGIARVGAHDNFFQLGGHSLLATQLVARVRHALDLEVPLRSLLQQPTVAGLAREIEALRRTASGAPEVPPLVPVPRGADLPLSFAQQRLWFLGQLEPGSPAYNMPFGLRLSGRLDVGALRGTFLAIVRRHESLRTVFRSAGGVPRQAVLPAEAADLPLIDLSGLPPAERDLRLADEAAAAFWRPFDLERGPLVRAQLFRLDGDEHAVVFCLHHIVSDAWSMGILVREITALYGAAIQGQASPLPPLPVQYADFAAWQRSWLQGEALERQIDFWKRSLSGAEPLALPIDRSAALSSGSWRPGQHWFSVPPDLTARLKELAQGNEATLFMVTLSAFKTVLLRISGQRDLSIGIPIANRTRMELEGLIGFFVNTLVLRTETAREATFRDLLRQVRTVSLDAQAHQDLPFEKLIEELDPERNLDETPLFRVMFDLTVNPLPAIQFPGLRLAPLAAGGGEAKFDLLLNLRQDGSALQGYVEYRSVLFEPTTIQRLAAYFVAILESAVTAPGRRLAEIPMLGAGERHQVVVERNERRRDLPVTALFPEMFAAQVRRAPEATALIYDRGDDLGRVSYGELADRARRLARWLAGQGVGPGVMVALCMDRTPYLAEGILGILLSGGGYLPLEPDLPAERMELMLRDSGARLVLTRESLLPRVPALVPVVCLDRDAERLGGPEGPEGREPAAAPSPHDPALMIYTSGSTGQPKGAVTPHRALAWFSRMAIDQYELHGADRLLQVCSIGFDVSMEETFPYLACGAALCLWSDPLLRSPACFLEQSRRWGVTAWSPPTAFWHAVVDEIGAGAEIPSTLRLVVLGGEAVSPAHLAVWRARVGSGVRLINTYGPTETTVAATLRDLRDPTAGAEGGPVPIGRPLPGAEVHLLDESLEPVPLGVTGEIFLGGGGRVWGYLGYPDLTAEKFVPHPFAAEPGERLYRTGDLGRSQLDGDLEFVGRTDHQVKIRGFRVEPGEVDAALGLHPQVRSSVTLVWQPTAGDRRLVTWFVAQPGEAPALSELRSFLQTRLPSYMVPSSLEPIAEIPLNRNGKVDRRALPAPQNARAAAEAYVAPSGPVEEALAAVWADVLRLDRVGVQDNFFTLGGHSLLATQVVSRIREALGVELPLRRIFEASTIRQIAQEIDRELGAANAAVLGPSAAAVDGGEPLSFAQQRLWFLDQLEPGNPAYNLPLPVRLTGELSLEALERTFAEVARRHAALRTTFAVQDGQPVQVIADPAPLDLRVLDLSNAPDEARGEWASELAREDARHPFDLRTGPLLRLGLLRLAEQEHLLVVTLHHIVADGWSVGVLLREIEVLYPAFVRGEASPLPELPLQYGDFARWQRGWLQGEILDGQIAWWKEALAGAPVLLELPADRPRPPVQTYRGASIDLTLPPALSAAIGELCRREEVTPFMLLLAAWAVVLGRHAGQDDVLVGTPIAGRNRRETEELIGFFVNTLVLRTGLKSEGGFTFRDLLGRVRDTALDAFAHQDLPFELLVDALAVERSLAHTPLIQVLLALQNAPAGALRLPGLTLSPVSWPSATAKFDLALGFVETAEGFAGSLEYATDLFDRTTAERFLRHLANLLASAVEDPGRPLSGLRLLDAAEERLLVAGLNRTERSWAFPVLVHDLFTRQAARTPGKPAAVGPQGAMTYREIDERSAALANAIRTVLSGPRLDRRIGLLADPGPHVLVGMLGILKADGGFVPIDPRHPDERVAWMLEDSACEVLVTERRYLERVAALGPRSVLCLDEVGPGGAAYAGERRDSGELRALAYIVYTSGSTGRPKGVQVSHESLVPMLLWGCEYFALGEHTRVLQSLSHCFDFGIFEHLTTVLAGGTLCFPGEAAGDPAAFAREIVRQVINTLHTTPVFAHELAGARQALDSLEIVHLGGEALSQATVARLREAAPRATLYNGYGPTEATINSSIHRIGGAEDGWPVVPIGRRSADNALYVMDREGRLLPFGARGELHVGGIGVARGYLNRPDLTAERFVPDLFGAHPGGRLYRTGDLVRYLPGGDVEFLGRIDHQVKIRGFRIELGEIEAVLRSHPAVGDAVVQVWDESGDRRLAAWVVPDQTDHPTDPTDPTDRSDLKTILAAWLREKLPEHMVPSAFVILEALPLTANGKVDRAALPAPDLRGDESSYVPPADELEERLAGIWQEVLQLDRIGVHDNFFALGGHSLLATQVVSRVREVLGKDMPLRRIFEAPTISQLAEGIREDRPAEPGAPALASFAAVVKGGGEPLSFAQQRLWFLDQLEPGNPAYNIPLAVRLTGELSPEALERSFAEVVRRHAALRTTFALEAGQPVQVIADPAPPDLRVLDLSDAPDEAREAWASRLAQEDAWHPFDLRCGPLLRLGLLRLAAQEHLLVVTLHHIVADGWSVGVLLREFGTLYPAFLRGEPSPLVELPLQYADFARWQRGFLQGDVLRRQTAYWKENLAGASVLLELPTDRPRPAVQTNRGASLDLVLPAPLSTAVHDLCRREEVTPFMLLVAAWAVVLGRHAGQEDVLVGTPIAGRNRREIEELIGLFLNTLVLRIGPGAGSTFRELLRRVRETTLDAFAHQDLPFELLIDELAVERSLAHAPLIQVLLSLQNASASTLRLPGLTLAPLNWPSVTAKLDLALSLVESAGGFAGLLEYATDLFDRTTAERFLRHLVHLLESAVENAGQPLSELRLLDAAEERLLTAGLNQAERSWACPAAVHDLLTRQAGRTPDKIAAVGPQGAMTYREIEERSTGLAAQIQAVLPGARLDRRIGLLADPGPQVLIGMLGILEAGGGFVPIDPRHPDERIAWILEDSACEVLVTERRHLERVVAPCHVLCLDEAGAGGTMDAGERRDSGELRSLAYVVYTSGSTGRPKGVQVSHESLVPMLLWGCEYFGLGEHTRVLQGLSHCFDFGIFEHLTTVLAGGTLCFPGEAAGDPAAFAREIIRQDINTLHTTPAFAHELAAARQTLDRLEVIHLGGEALSQATVARLREAAPRATLYNGYGPTEATVNSSIYRIGEDAGWPVVSIGRRSADNALYVLDRAGRLSPFGARGELHVGGIGVARGYLGRPDLTAERFVPDPFGAEPGGRLYRTGDLVRSLPGGDLEFLGRIDHQVKIRGFRIELGEIEAVLRSHPAVGEAVVQVRDEGGDRRLAAWVTLDRSDPTDDPTDPTDPTDPSDRSDAKSILAAWLREKLPEHMVPSAFAILEALPRTANGKVDRAALPAPDRSGDASSYEPPGDAMEELLAGIWQEVLRLDRVGAHDNFFALGGHSLLATQVVSRVREVLGMEMSLRRVFEAPTLRQMAESLRPSRPAEPPSG